MLEGKKKAWKSWIIFLAAAGYLAGYAVLSLHTLGTFPFVHSDECWLAGLTRDMMAARDFGVSESFFSLKPRVPHALKLLFHGAQMAAVSVLGFQIGAVRILSWMTGLLCLALCYLVGKRLGGRGMGTALMALVSVDIQFLYASHFARQEIGIAACLLFCVAVLLGCGGVPSRGQAAALAAVTGLGVGIHPNSFLCASACGCMMAAGAVRRKKEGAPVRDAFQSLAVYAVLTGIAAAVFVGISFTFSPHFLPDYFRYGEEEFELSRSAAGRLGEFFAFFRSVIRREGVTYYLPLITPQFVIMAASGGMAAVGCAALKGSGETEAREWLKHTQLLAAGLLGLCLGMMVIGRFSQLSVLFFLLFGWMFVAQALQLFEGWGRFAGAAGLWVLMAFLTAGQVRGEAPRPEERYEGYLSALSEVIPKDAAVLGNLNALFCFGQGEFYDFRDLPYTREAGGVEAYIRERGITYICYPAELDYIYGRRPYYNVVYGNAMFIGDLKEFCEKSCEKAGEIYSGQYGTRLIPLLSSPEYGWVSIYRVKGADGS